MKKNIIYLLIFIFPITLLGYSYNPIERSLIQDFINSEYEYSGRVKIINPHFYKNYFKLFKNTFLIADSNSVFNPTDMITEKIPSKQIIFAGIQTHENTKGFIYYRKGGVVISSYIIIYDFSKKRHPNFVIFSVENDIRDLNSMKEFVRSNFN
jgi:hypothetical protein